jgi:hypothetical protein
VETPAEVSPLLSSNTTLLGSTLMARTLRPTGVAAELFLYADADEASGRCEAMADLGAIAICRIIVGVA